MKRIANILAIFRSQRLLILLLCFTAALRVFVFAAAFPFFSNGDEDLHFDLITQYSAGPAAAHIRCADGRIAQLYRSLRFAGIPSNARSVAERKISDTFVEAIRRGGGARY